MVFQIVKDFRIKSSSTSEARTGGTSRILTATPISKEARHQIHDEIVAIKFFNDINISSDINNSDNFHYEVYLMNSLPKSTPNVIQMLGFSPTERAVIMPFYELSLSQLVREKKFRLPPSKIQKIAYDIAEGMRVLHDEANILHLDLKPGNILIDTKTLPNMPTCVICDFGYANHIGDDIPVVAGIRMPTAAGFTCPYAAPEILNDMFVKRYSRESDKPIDVYAYAMTMYEVLMQRYPWTGMNVNQIKENVMTGKRPSIEPKSRFEDIPMILQIVADSWSQDPIKRPSFKNITELLLKSKI